MAYWIKVELCAVNLRQVDVGVDDAFLVPQRASENVAHRSYNAAASFAPDRLLSRRVKLRARISRVVFWEV